MGSSTTREQAGPPQSRIDPGRRVQWLRTPGDIDASTELDADAKAAAKALLQANATHNMEELPDHGALKKREPIMGLLQRDPDLAGALMGSYVPLAAEVIGLTYDQIGIASTHAAGIRGATDDSDEIRRYEIAMLFVYVIAYDRRDEWTLRLMATMPQLLTAEKCAMLGFSESSVWSDEERLVLEFTRALRAGDVSDGLYERALAMWGLKGMMRYTRWIAQYEQILMFGCLNIKDCDKRAH